MESRNESKNLHFGCYLFFALNANGQFPECWRLVWEHDLQNGIYNYDSVMVDTCISDTNWYENWANKVLYAKKWFCVILPNNALYIPECPYDSIVERNWTDIDSSFSNLRVGFQILENTFGQFVLRKEYPHITDSNSTGSKSFLIRFINYVNIDSAEQFLKNIDGINRQYYFNKCYKLLGNFKDYQEPSFQLGNLENNWIKEKAVNHYIVYHKRSLQWNILSIHSPMAGK
jgi:hypothetical protein